MSRPSVSTRSIRGLLLRSIFWGAVLAMATGGFAWDALAQSAALSAQVQQSQAQVQQLQQRQQTGEQRRTRLLEDQRKLLSLQGQIQTQIDQIRKELQKPLAPDQVEKQRCALREQRVKQQQVQQRQEQVRRDLIQNQQQLSQTGRQLSQAQQQLSQAQQQLEQAQQQEQAAQQAGRQDKLSKIMQAPADPLNGLPLTATPGSGGKRLIVLGIQVLFKTPSVTSITYDPGSATMDIVHGLAGGSWRVNFIFTMSDESIQIVRARIFRDAISPPGGFVGLLLERTPARMNARVANLVDTFGQVNTWVSPPGISDRGRIIIDVPDDPSIEPAIVYYIAH